MSAFEACLELVQLLGIGAVIFECCRIRVLLAGRSQFISEVSDRINRLENKHDQVLQRLVVLDRFKPGEDDPT